MNQKLKENIKESLSAVLPITLIVLIISVIFVPMDIGTVALFLTGALLLVIGMGLFQLGAEMAMTPLGEGVGVQLSKTKRLWQVGLVAFIMGVAITIAEPDLQVLAGQVPSIPNSVLIFTVALGVGIFLVVAIFRILFQRSLSLVLIVLYGLLFLLSGFAPGDFLAVAFDSGGVTTGPITVPFIMAVGVGLASVRSDKHAADDSFGLVALGSIGPMLAVLILGIFYRPSGATYSGVDLTTVQTTRDVVREFTMALPHYAKEVFISLMPVAVVLSIVELSTRRFHRRQLVRAIVGLLYTYLGLVLFLCGVNVGFAPVGSMLGSLLVSGGLKWLLVPVGLVIGYFIVLAEPAVQVLNRQIEEVTDGAIPGSAMNKCLSIGVAASVGLAMIRVLTGIHIYWLLIPGYAIALILSRIVPSIFIGIAFDSGGVASGPMATTFLLPMAMGACEMLGGDVMTEAFGVVAMVAMTPLIAVQIMGLLYGYRKKKSDREQTTQIEDEDDIVELEEETQ